MKRETIVNILIGIVVLVVVILSLSPVIVEPWIKKKIENALNEKYKDYAIEIGKVDFSIISSEIELEKITIASRQERVDKKDVNGEIASVKFKGIKLLKALFNKDFDIDEVSISNFTIKGEISFPKKKKTPTVSKINIRIGKVSVGKINLALVDSSTAKTFSVKEGVLKVHDIQIGKQDTLNNIIRHFDFNAEEFLSISADSMYTYKADGISYSDSLNTLSVNGFLIQPNYNETDFTARHKYQIDRIDAMFSNISMNHFPAADYFQKGKLVSSSIEIGKMDLNVFRDKRKEFKHVNKPTFQEMIYSYPGVLRIDSIRVLSGNITYTEHAEKANEPGKISVNELNAKIYKITNDTVFKAENAVFELKAEALLMGKGKVNVILRAKLHDPTNAFTVDGTLSAMEVKELNPMLEKNAFIFATAGTINSLNFNFTADNTRATGKMNFLYHGLNLTVKNKRTDDTTAIKERFISIIANEKVMDSNPVPGQEARVGLIDYKRNPERFIFNYCVKSVLTGIKSSILKNPKEKKEKKTLLQKIFGKAGE